MAKAHTLVDNFNDDAIDTTKWTVSGPAQEVNGRVEITPLSAVANSFGKYSSATTYDLTYSEISLEFARLARAGTSFLVAVDGVVGAGGDFVSISARNDRVQVAYRVSGVVTDLATIPYDEAVHRWMRIREDAGITYFEHAEDGLRWSEIARTPTPFALTAVTLEFSALSSSPAPGTAVFDNFNTPESGRARRVEERRLSARDVRVQAAELAAARRHEEHASNNDEVNYPDQPLTGNYSKSLKHNQFGDPDPASFASMLRALESRDPADFEVIQLASSTAVKLTSPQAGLTFDLEGPDAQALTQPPAPRFDSLVAAHEAGELYWMAVARDVPFFDYGTNTDIAAAVSSLNSEFAQFGGTVPVTTRNVFRGIFAGEQVGPYVSQFLWKGNVDPRRPAGQGRDAADGYVSYGSRTIDQRLFPAVAGTDYLTGFSAWLNVQNGVDARGADAFESTKRFIRSLRDGATFVHFDNVLDAFYNAAWILISEPTGDQKLAANATGRPQLDLEFPFDQGNPYDPPGTAMDSRTQGGFATFGQTHLLQVLGDVLGRALRAVWWQKWGVHRRLRPEEYGGRVDNQIVGRGGDYPMHFSITDSLTTGALSTYFGSSGDPFTSNLLPQAYPEGAPTHPAYGAGHGTGAAACATILKAFFDDTKVIENPLQASADGLSLVAYTPQTGEPAMTVGGELNKLAGNISLFRNAAGVHWRSDHTESLLLGERIAIGLLQEMSIGFNEDDAFFQLTKFDGQTVRIFDGRVVPVA